jgi:transposase
LLFAWWSGCGDKAQSYSAETTVGGWVKKYRAAHAADEPPLGLSERALLRELERRTRELEIENAFLKKVAAHFAREQR